MDKNNLDETIDKLAGKLADAVPGELHDLKNDLEKNFRGLLSAGLDKLDLVTREEYEVQRKVLERTREKLDRLEREIAALQSRADSKESGPGPGDT